MTIGEVHVGDVGTLYKARIIDAGEDFNIASADVHKLIFDTPDGVVERTATITTTGSGTNQKWFLTYTVLTGDIADGLHQSAGAYNWQGYVHFPDDQEYHTNVERFIVKSNLN